MSQDRPTGLTIVGRLNVAFGVLALFFIIFGALTVAVVRLQIIPDLPPEYSDKAFAPLRRLGPLRFSLLTLLNMMAAVVLLISGIGLLKRRRVMGRQLTTAYAAYSLLAEGFSLLTAAGERTAVSVGFSAFGIIYSLLLLYLVNVTYADHLRK